MWFLALGCPSAAPPAPVDSVVPHDLPHDSAPPPDSQPPGDSGRDTGTPAPVADIRFEAPPGPPLVGVGAQIWPGDTRWTDATDPLGARIVRVALNANLGSRAVDLPVDTTAAEWDTWFDTHALDAAPDFLSDLQDSLTRTDARGIRWIGHQWEAPPAWESPSGQLKAEHVDDFAALTGALYGWLSRQGIEPDWIELCNEPDGDWNSYVDPVDYDALVLATRSELDARGLGHIGILGPGLATLGGWTDPPSWVPTLSDAAVDALDGWSAHTWDDYAEAGEGHLYLAERWRIFVDQVAARDPDKPVFATEMGSKDLSFGGATYTSADAGSCGFVTESDGYAVRLLAELAVALAAGADGISWWEAADQSWECSRWGMVDTAGRARRFHTALASFTSALPEDGGAVGPTATDLAAVAVLGAERGVVLVVNDTGARVSRSVAVAGGWQLVEARPFGTDERVLYDELVDDAQGVWGKTLAVDDTNTALFDEDAARAFRTSEGDGVLVWSPGGALVSATLTAWSWNGASPVSVGVEASADGASWAPVSVAETVTTPGWNRHDLRVDSFPAGARQLRVVLPAEGFPTWTPQLGDLSLRWRLDDPAATPTGEAPWTLDLPADSAMVLVLSR